MCKHTKNILHRLKFILNINLFSFSCGLIFSLEIMKFFFVCAFLTFIGTLNAHISIKIDPEDLGEVSDFILNLQNHREHHYDVVNSPTKCKLMQIVTKTMISIIQLVGFMMAMIGSNIITTKLSPLQAEQRQLQEVQPDLHALLNNISQINTCNINFGCNKNVCWKTCYVAADVDDDENIKKQELWCYTSPNPKIQAYHQCVSHTECSPCWECLEACHV